MLFRSSEGAISELLHSGLFDLETEVVLFQSVEWIFLISGALTVAYMLKLFVALFLTEPTRPPHSRRSYVSVPSSVILCLSALLPLLLGLFPNRLMDPIGALSTPFMNGHPPSHPVDYFAWANLKGAMLTLALGAAFYFIIVYVRLMREDASGRRRYVDLWPRWMDLERLLYRPILTGLLPFLGALLARVVDVLCETAARRSKRLPDPSRTGLRRRYPVCSPAATRRSRRMRRKPSASTLRNLPNACSRKSRSSWRK